MCSHSSQLLARPRPSRLISTAVLSGVLLSSVGFFPASGFACPRIRRLVDFNCDREIKVVVAGDSIVYGRGDLDNGNRGGWVKRLGPALRVKNVVNLGVPGITTSRLYSRLVRKFKNETSSLRTQAINADIFILSVGANDFYDEGDPSLTARNIKRLVALVRKHMGRGELVTPYVLVAKLTPTTRGFQRSFFENVNRILARYRSNALPTYLRFDTMSEEYVSSDGLHPISSGYEQLTEIATSYLKNDATAAMKSNRPDKDRDGIFDMFEKSKFNTDPTSLDSDSDGLSDGREEFRYQTDPNNPDTDTDGFSDGEEITLPSNPLDPFDPQM